MKYPSAISCGVILSKNSQFLLSSNSYLLNKWHQIVRNSPGILSNHSTRMCSNWIEVPKKNHSPFWICSLNVPRYFFNKKLYIQCFNIRAFYTSKYIQRYENIHSYTKLPLSRYNKVITPFIENASTHFCTTIRICCR